ncbi:plasma membrane fusion protein prm1 [Kluyveromyces marxianus]|nr:plasma membrane fusion protein prm1 [Kluyveromyces marxianus]
MNHIYLHLNERLSQIWCNQYTVIILIMMIKIILFTRMLSNGFDNIRDYTLSNCESIDYYYSKFVDSTPHYMGKMGNYLIEKSMQETVSLSLKLISLLVTVSENVIDFMIDLWLGTWVCLAVSAIDASVDVATNTTESILNLVNGTVKSVANDLDDGLDGLSKIINKILSAVNDIKNFFTGNDNESDVDNQFKHVNLTVNRLRTLSIPNSINEKLEKLAGETPDFDTVKNKTKKAVAIPFNYVRKEIKTINSSKLVGNPQYLTVPPIDTNGTKICSANKPKIEEFFNALSDLFSACMIAILIIFLCAAVGFVVYTAWSEWRQWRRLEIFRDEFHHQNIMLRNPFDDNADEKALERVDILETYQMVFHRYQSGFGRSLNGTMNQGMTTWSNSANLYINDTESHINTQAFGWIQNTTATLNGTVTDLLDDIDSVIAKAFNGTILYKPMNSVMKCVIGNKLETISKALDWVHDTAHVTLPRVNNTQIYDAINNEMANGTTTNATASTQNSNSNPNSNSMLDDLHANLVNSATKLLAQYKKSVTIELIVSLVFLALYAVQIPIAAVILALQARKRALE